MRMTRRRGFAEDAPKKPTNVSVSGDLLAAARANKINLSQTLEEALREKLRKIEQQRWLEENREAIEEHNRFVQKYGVFSDGRRRF
jgi:antitoxin CcdA